MGSVLIVDDDIDLCHLMAKCVSQEGYLPLKAHSAQSAYSIINDKESDLALIILDIMLPDSNGLDLLAHISSKYTIPVIMVTAKDSLEDKVIGLRLGADDYLTKPFSLSELGARVNALIRRYVSSADTTVAEYKTIEFGNLKINYDLRTVLCNDTEVYLTGKEFDILYLLAKNKGRVLTKKQIYESVWSDQYVYDDNSIMSIICKIRRKLETCAPANSYIDTIRGIGYRFNRKV